MARAGTLKNNEEDSKRNAFLWSILVVPEKCIKKMSGTIEENHTSEWKMGSLQLQTQAGVPPKSHDFGNLVSKVFRILFLNFFFFIFKFFILGQMKNASRKRPIKSSYYRYFHVCSVQKAIVLRYCFPSLYVPSYFWLLLGTFEYSCLIDNCLRIIYYKIVPIIFILYYKQVTFKK